MFFNSHPFVQIKEKCELVFRGKYQVYDEDVIYEAMLSICNQYHKHKDTVENFKAWLNGAIHHHFCVYVNQKKKQQLMIADSDFEFMDETPDEFSEIKTQEVRDEISKLDPPRKEIMQLKFFEELSYSEIEVRLNMKQATIRKHVSRAIEHISKNLTLSVTILVSFLLHV